LLLRHRRRRGDDPTHGDPEGRRSDRPHRQRRRGGFHRTRGRHRAPSRRIRAGDRAPAGPGGLAVAALPGHQPPPRADRPRAHDRSRERRAPDVCVVSPPPRTRQVHTMSDADDAIPNAVPHLAGKEWQYVKACLDTNWVSSVGPFVDRFEREMAAYVEARHGIAVVTGTAALHAALVAAHVRPDDEVLVPSLTFVATANAIHYCGARPVFMDCDPRTWNLDPAKTAEFLARECELRRGALVNRPTRPPTNA